MTIEAVSHGFRWRATLWWWDHRPWSVSPDSRVPVKVVAYYHNFGPDKVRLDGVAFEPDVLATGKFATVLHKERQEFLSFLLVQLAKESGRTPVRPQESLWKQEAHDG